MSQMKTIKLKIPHKTKQLLGIAQFKIKTFNK